MDTQNNNFSIIAGGLLIVLGLVFFAVTQGAFSLTWYNSWPIFLIIGGCIVLYQAFRAHAPYAVGGLVLGGTIPFLVGVFLFTFTFGLFEWGDMAWLWPIFLLIVGVAFWAGFFSSGLQTRGYLIPAVILTVVGIVFLAITLSAVGYGILGKLWPIFLIAAGIILLTQRYWRTRAQ